MEQPQISSSQVIFTPLPSCLYDTYGKKMSTLVQPNSHLLHAQALHLGSCHFWRLSHYHAEQSYFNQMTSNIKWPFSNFWKTCCIYIFPTYLDHYFILFNLLSTFSISSLLIPGWLSQLVTRSLWHTHGDHSSSFHEIYNPLACIPLLHSTCM